MGKVKLAVATNGSKGLGDEVASAFALAKTFTLATVDRNRVHVEVLKNPAVALSHGRGRTVVQVLKERGVDIVVASEFGPGASALLEQSGIRKVVVKAGTMVSDVIRDKLYKKG
jgi:predicted Fe-Mo cluster-binding NifX family protein